MSRDGGPAFPVKVAAGTSAHGLSVRDYFAAAALQGILAAGHPLARETAGELPTLAYAYADAMLVERAK